MARSLPLGRRHGADRRLPYGKEVTVSGISLMLALALLLLVIDQLRR